VYGRVIISSTEEQSWLICIATRTTSKIDADPYPTYRRLRDEAPLYYNEKMDFLGLSRYADIEPAIKDWRRLSSAKGDILEMVGRPCSASMATPQNWFRRNSARRVRLQGGSDGADRFAVG
jgi:cytochrome P450